MLEAPYAEELNLKVGDRVELLASGRRHPVTLVGLYLTTSSTFPQSNMVSGYVFESTLQSVQPDRQRWERSLDVRLRSGSASQFVRDVYRLYAPGEITADRTWESTFAFVRFFNDVTGLGFYLFSVFTLVGIGIMVGNSASGFAIARFRDIGLLKAIGFTPGQAIAFALGPLLGRGGAAGVAGIALALAWAVNGLDLGPLAALSPFRWTEGHVALTGLYDWPGLALVGVAAAAFLALGVEAFSRRDLGVTLGVGLPTLPGDLLGVRGPTSRAFGDQLPRALAWGLGLGIMGALLASLVGSMSGQIAGDTNLLRVIRQVFPSFDLTSAGGFLQLFVELFFIAAGFAASTFVSKWASDETGDRLEEVLATPLTRTKWVVAGGVAALAAVVVMTVLFALGVGLGAAGGGVSAGTAMAGSASLGLYAAALVGIGIAIGGAWRTSLAAEVVALIVVATYLVDLLAPPLGLPDWFHQLALTAHLGQPMVGVWDPVGVAACLVFALGGIAVGAWGLRRRDVAR